MASTPSRYPVPGRAHRVEETIRRSRFVTTLARATDAEAAEAVLAAVRDELPEATHYCWAYVAGPPGSTTSVGMSDDGEPHGTAGRPMLNALLHAGVGEVVAVCARYYGGTKLGTGGLSRAYAGGVTLALEGLPVEERIERVMADLRVGYADVDAVQHLLHETEARIDGQEYGADVRYRVAVPRERVAELERRIADATSGEGEVEVERE